MFCSMKYALGFIFGELVLIKFSCSQKDAESSPRQSEVGQNSNSASLVIDDGDDDIILIGESLLAAK